MEPLLQENPQYVIIFSDSTPENADVLARLLNVAPASPPDAEPRRSRRILDSHNGVHARVYMRLGVAVANLTPQQVQELEVLGNVVAVARNQRRHLPTYQVDAEEPTPEPPGTPLNRALQQIGLDPATQTATGRGVKVAVIDTGIDLSHPDLTLLPENARSFVPSEPSAQDENGHGTHCAGVIAGRARPTGGFRYGVAPDAQLLVGKALNKYGQGYDDQILDAIDWAADQGAEIISLSLGSERVAGQPFSATYERVAATLLEQGVLLVAAAGNESLRPQRIAPVGNPAACPSVLAVAAVDDRDRVAVFSSADVDGVGQVDVAAPGVAVYSAWPGGGYRRLSGTSMATPHVAGVAALYAEGDPALTGRALWARLTERARPVDAPATDVGSGVVQVP
ncbi:S8 family peptidase [Deinococcus maricopensis]|uniref:Subtilisin n=1 Tax=Deinococcus maricopensis (strain DSM 21211 / LMG 22137 / NRRL B-23946 / LB-34) TaxID=709986 RepID=E8U3D5_DEIML|nr:S8 family serine peptidase [Deinococcus maricopensis]ADV65806.1 Subtilisin [Deinococcus maricopensis DSM 21211]